MTRNKNPSTFQTFLSLFSLSFLLHVICLHFVFAANATLCKCWRSWNRFKVRELRDGSSFLSCAPYQSRFLRFFSTFISSVSIPSPALFYLQSCQRNTHVMMKQWGQSLCPRRPICSCSAVFSGTCLYKPTAHEQLLSHTRTHKHTCWYLCEDDSVHLFLR